MTKTLTNKIEISIENWTKFNARTDRANYSWFRLQNDFFHDQAIFGLTNDQVVLYLFILCECSKKNCGSLTLVTSYIYAMRKIDEQQIVSDLEALSHAGLLSFEINGVTPSSRHQLVSNSLATYRQTDKHIGGLPPATKCPPVGGKVAYDFESIYRQYPKRLGDQGKKKGLEYCQRHLATDEKFAALETAVKNYADHCNQENKTGTSYVKQFVTFVRSGAWEEFRHFEPTYSINTTPIKIEDIT
jgi:hypothetical protein